MNKPHYLLDTNIWIYLVTAARNPDKYPQLIEREAVAKNRVKLSLIVIGELVKGAAKSNNREAHLQHIEALRRRYDILKFDYETARHYGEVCAATATQPIGSNDAWIAAQALRHRLTLVTHNAREFRRIPGLMMEDWV